MFVGLGVVLPIIFFVGVSARKPSPVMSSLPAGLEARPDFSGQSIPLKTFAFTHSPALAKVFNIQPGSNLFTAEISSAKELARPDVLVYWVSGNPGELTDLPAQAILLGELGTLPLSLPATARQGGVLILYSLADGELVDSSKPISF